MNLKTHTLFRLIEVTLRVSLRFQMETFDVAYANGFVQSSVCYTDVSVNMDCGENWNNEPFNWCALFSANWITYCSFLEFYENLTNILFINSYDNYNYDSITIFLLTTLFCWFFFFPVWFAFRTFFLLWYVAVEATFIQRSVTLRIWTEFRLKKKTNDCGH